MPGSSRTAGFGDNVRGAIRAGAFKREVTVVLWILLIVIIGALAVVVLYNGFVRLRNLSDNAWSDIDVQLKRRHDLVPNVVEAVKGYAGYERAIQVARERGVKLPMLE